MWVVVVAVAAAIACAARYAVAFVRNNSDANKPESRSYNMLVADGKEVLFFRGVSADSVMVGMAFADTCVSRGDRVTLDSVAVRSVVDKTASRIARRIALLETSIDEMNYYMKTHGVQDEGYDMVAGRFTEASGEVAMLMRLQALLDSLGAASKIEVVHRAFRISWSGIVPSGVFVEKGGGQWRNGMWLRMKKDGAGISVDSAGRIISGDWNADTLASGFRTDSGGVYSGMFAAGGRAQGHGRYVGTDGSFYEGHWEGDRRDGFGFAVDSVRLRVGEWKGGSYKGERMNYTSERIYGIDISRYQHEIGKKYYPIYWDKLRITNLGALTHRRVGGAVDFPVSFIYIKSTESTSIRNRYYSADYAQARKHGLRVGSYHFFSTRTDAAEQARYFIKNSLFRHGDFPPVLDVEPTTRQVVAMGGPNELFRRIRIWLDIVEKHAGVRPILYMNQSFANKYLDDAPDIKRDYDVWIARYGEYRPDLKLMFWQLCSDGKVAGIHGRVDINVFNGYQDRYESFIEEKLIK